MTINDGDAEQLQSMPLKLIAHRGYTARYPENTIIGIEAAIEAGAKFVEVDVQLAADGMPMLFHDRMLDRMCGMEGSIADYPPQQLAQFSAAEPGRFGDTFARTPIARLDELAALIRRSPTTQFFIELKRISIEHSGADNVLQQTIRTLEGLQHACTLISFDAEILEMAKRQGWRTGIVVEKWGQVLNCARITQSHEGGREGKKTAHNSRPDPIFCIFCNVDGLPPSGSLHLPDIQLAVYEVTDPKLAIQLAARGVDFVETFEIGDMYAALNVS